MVHPPPESAVTWSSPELAEHCRTLDASELVLFAQQLISAGAPAKVLALCELARNNGVNSRGLALCEAAAQFGLGQRTLALQGVSRLVEAAPNDCVALMYRAQMLVGLGRVDEATTQLEALLGVAPDYPGALPLLAKLVFPGPSYRQVLSLLHEELRPRCYMEIGVEHGESLALATHSDVVIGIDPVPRLERTRLPAGARIFTQTSDSFFAAHRREDVLDQQRLDLTFIDGLHLFEQVLADLCNVERWSHPGSTIVLHDCLPVASTAALRQRRTTFWVGDCWRALTTILEHRPDLAVATVPCFPSGLVLLRRVDPESTRLQGVLPTLTPQQTAAPMPIPSRMWRACFPMIDNTADGVRAFLAATRVGASAQ